MLSDRHFSVDSRVSEGSKKKFDEDLEPNNFIEDSGAPSSIESDAYAYESASIGNGKKYIKGSGTINIEIYKQEYSRPLYKIMLFFSIFLVAYAYSIDGLVRFTYQYQATSKWKNKSSLKVVKCVKTVMCTAGQLGIARSADIFGRTTVLNMSILLYVVGTLVQCKASNISMFGAGTCLYQFGFVGVQLILQLIAMDFSDLNWRLVASFVPAWPFVINIWISGFITQAIGERWSWGIGMFAFIIPCAYVPLGLCLLHMRYLAYRNARGKMQNEFKMYQQLTLREYLIDIFFWRLDFIGFVLLSVFFGCIPIPLLLGGGISSHWKEVHIIVPEVLGWVAALPAFLTWEAKVAKHPLLTWDMIGDRGIIAALIIAFYINFNWHLFGDYMFTVFLIALDQSVLSATRITSLYSLVCIISGTFLGFIIVKARRTKPFIIFGICCWFLAFGLLVHFFGKQLSIPGITVSLGTMGLGAGFFTYTTQASVQAAVKTHAKMAVATALYLSVYSIGSAVGSAVTGAIWTNVLPKELYKILNHTEADAAYNSPNLFILTNAYGTAPRRGLVTAYAYTQKILCIVGLCFCVPLLLAALFLRNHKLESTVALENVDSDAVEEDEKRHDIISKIKSRTHEENGNLPR
ncbi:hypothetical protein HG537_0G00140 [Torulaspora globosa]|uniref:Major facilitator superfamily (MFS) profile domain-containing protein n=1 Tax=Torulaspora globosa TaxID=48254 RepID=A0A7H9HWQ2_9SACH|nr:hypothetical protein HG537_0G00140 [Torulaspora sp. CBS 2947]